MSAPILHSNVTPVWLTRQDHWVSKHTPSGKLRVPHEGVAAHELAIGVGETGNAVASRKAELVAVRLGGVPFLYQATHGLATEQQAGFSKEAGTHAHCRE